MAKVRKYLTFDQELLAKVQDYADRAGISLSGAFSVIVTSYFDNLKALDSMRDFVEIAARQSLSDNKL